jgi:hypothetical protein
MNTLEILYENKIQSNIFLERKEKITDKYTIILAPKLSGTSYLIYDYLTNYQDDEYLYIDLKNLKNLEFNFEHLDNFITLKDIKVLVIENYDYSFVLPKVSSIILSVNIYKQIKQFSLLKLMPLDFEEYLSFDTKQLNITNSFNSFLKYGNIAQIINFKDINKQNRNKEILQLSILNETKYDILKLLIKNSGQIKSTYLLYSIYKKTNKISKDFFYKSVKEFEQNNTILTCSKYNSPKAAKKIFCYNHAFIDTVTYNKNFSYVFSNMIYLELFTKYQDIFYSDNIDFYIKESSCIILSIPFYNQTQISNISSKILKIIEDLKCTKIFIITISNRDNIYIDNISCEILPFYEWATTI